MYVTPSQFGATPEKQMTGTLDINTVVVVRLPRHMEGNGVTPIFRSLQIWQFHHRRLESLGHFDVLYIYIILSTTVSHFWTLRMPFFLQGLPFLYTFQCLQVHCACVLCI